MHRNTLRLFATMLVALGLLTLGVIPAIAQEELSVDVTIDQATVNPQTGEVTLAGTVTCSQPASIDISGELLQQLGRSSTVQGFFFARVECPGPEGSTFSLTVTPEEGRFIPGAAHLIARIAGCIFVPELGYCVRISDLLDTTVRLTPAR